MQYPPPGYNDVPAYLASGLPFVTASSAPTTALKVTFPYVTKFITIRAAGALNVGFTPEGVSNSKHYTMANGIYLTMDVRVKEIYLIKPGGGGGSTGFQIVAGLTGIPTASVPTLTSSYAFNPADPYFTGSNAYTNVLVYQGI